MKIDKLNINLPKEKESIGKFFAGCIERKRIIKDTEGHYEKHLKKAKHDLTRAIAEFDDECWDWTIVKAYYAIHHAANALLSYSKQEFCKDHSCLIIALKYHNLIADDLFESLMDINKRFSDILSLDLMFQLRKIGQYGVDEWDTLTEEDAETILKIAKSFISYVEEKT